MDAVEKRREIVHQLSNELNMDADLGVTGSTANGTANKNSDIDLFTMINTEDINNALKRLSRVEVFNMPSEDAVRDFKRQNIEVMFLYGKMRSIPLTLEVYSLNSVRKLLKLEGITLTRFRVRKSDHSLYFSSALGKFHRVNMNIQSFADGYLSSLPGSLKIRGTTYIGNHLRKILFGEMYVATSDIRDRIRECLEKLVREGSEHGKSICDSLTNLAVYEQHMRVSPKLSRFYQALSKSIQGDEVV